MAKIAFRAPMEPISSSTTNVEQMPMIEDHDQTCQHRAKVLRRRRWSCAIFLALVVAVAAALTFTSLNQDPFRQCDKQCRSAYGFYDRSITGVRLGAFGQHCKCHRAGEPVGEEQPWRSHKPWNETFWCGDFSTPLVCAMGAAEGEADPSSTPRTVTRSDAQLLRLTILHCGACAACSTLHDLHVLNSSKAFATVRVTECATAFAKPTWLGGHRNKAKLAACLVDAGIGFSQNGSAWAQPVDRPTCMDCWIDNVACDAVACVNNPDCIRRFFDPSGTNFAGCIECDEQNCGPEFIRCAGANRRSSGIISDISRPGQQVCPIGYWSPPLPPMVEESDVGGGVV
eukprot:CAMPEP_0119072646 /NCGR_PEP_ID=MMETSP1178-20130426/58501_1 /TAXON_ID=33656 /ORGANISM="unid sp, Strain CCMP2000" /LENGTH=341 /DNA_ID=CAMNT_0007054671 /DNA_START=153 /DNA_END=1175 /DNA_ORIENTATION=-